MWKYIENFKGEAEENVFNYVYSCLELGGDCTKVCIETDFIRQIHSRLQKIDNKEEYQELIHMTKYILDSANEDDIDWIAKYNLSVYLCEKINYFADSKDAELWACTLDTLFSLSRTHPDILEVFKDEDFVSLFTEFWADGKEFFIESAFKEILPFYDEIGEDKLIDDIVGAITDCLLNKLSQSSFLDQKFAWTYLTELLPYVGENFNIIDKIVTSPDFKKLAQETDSLNAQAIK